MGQVDLCMHTITYFLDGLNDKLFIRLFHGWLVVNLFFNRIFKLVLNTWLIDWKICREVTWFHLMWSRLPNDRAGVFVHHLAILLHTYISLVKIKICQLVLTIFLTHLEVLSAVHHHWINGWVLNDVVLALWWALNIERRYLLLVALLLYIRNWRQQMLRLNVYTIVKNIKWVRRVVLGDLGSSVDGVFVRLYLAHLYAVLHDLGLF